MFYSISKHSNVLQMTTRPSVEHISTTFRTEKYRTLKKGQRQAAVQNSTMADFVALMPFLFHSRRLHLDIIKVFYLPNDA